MATKRRGFTADFGSASVCKSGGVPLLVGLRAPRLRCPLIHESYQPFERGCGRSASPAAMAGVTRLLSFVRTAEFGRTLLYQKKYSESIAACFSSCFENPLVSRVKRRIDMRIFRLCPSTYDVFAASRSGGPCTTPSRCRRTGRRAVATLVVGSLRPCRRS